MRTSTPGRITSPKACDHKGLQSANTYTPSLRCNHHHAVATPAGEGLKELAAALQRALGAARVAEPDVLRSAPDTLAEARGGAAEAAVEVAVEAAPLAASTARQPASGERQPVASTSGRGAAAAGVAVAGAVGAGVAMAAAGRRQAAPLGAPPPAPAGWDDGGGWGADAGDAAAELSAEELAAFNERCRSLGLIDDKVRATESWAEDMASFEDMCMRSRSGL